MTQCDGYKCSEEADMFFPMTGKRYCALCGVILLPKQFVDCKDKNLVKIHRSDEIDRLFN